MDEYYLGAPEAITGPFKLTDLKEKGINAETLILKEGSQDWQPAGMINEVMEIIAENKNANRKGGYFESIRFKQVWTILKRKPMEGIILGLTFLGFTFGVIGYYYNDWGLANIILGGIIAVLSQWAEYLFEYTIFTANRTSHDIKKLAKRNGNIIKSYGLMVGIVLAFFGFQQKEKAAVRAAIRQEDTHRKIELISVAAQKLERSLNGLISQTDNATNESIERLANADANQRQMLAKLQLFDSSMNTSFLETRKNLSGIDTGLRKSQATIKLNFLSLTNQWERFQFPLPQKLTCNIAIQWSVLNVSKIFDNFILLHGKRPLLSEFDFVRDFEMTQDWPGYQYLHLAYNTMYLNFQNDTGRVTYKAMLQPHKIDNVIIKQQYLAILENSYKDASFLYNDKEKSIKFIAFDCPFELVASTPGAFSLLDIDHSKTSFEINPGVKATRFFNVEAFPDYIFGYANYNANNGIGMIREQFVRIDVSLLNGKFLISSALGAKSNSFALPDLNLKRSEHIK